MFVKTSITTEINIRRRSIIWFNPPSNKNVKTNKAKYILHLSNKHFDKTYRYHKILNSNNTIVSYSWMDNMEIKISS